MPNRFTFTGLLNGQRVFCSAIRYDEDDIAITRVKQDGAEVDITEEEEASLESQARQAWHARQIELAERRVDHYIESRKDRA